MFIQKNLLIIEQEKKFITSCQEILGAEEFLVWGATTVDQVTSMITQELFDLAILGFPLLDADTILHGLGTHQPHIPIIVCTATSELPLPILNQITKKRPVAFLEKPCPPDALRRIVATFFRRYNNEHVRGNLEDLTLTSLITTNCNEGNTVALEIWYDGKRGIIFFEKGQIVHAETAQQTGESAIYEIIGWQGGEFVMHMHESTALKTIFVSWSKVLLEGFQLLDEQQFDQEGIILDEKSADGADESFDFEEDSEFDSQEGGLDWSSMEDAFLSPAPPQSQASDITPETQDKIELALDELFDELTLRCIIFARQSGRLLYTKGILEENRMRSLTALIAGSFSADNEIAVKLVLEGEDEQQFAQSLQEGTDFSLYTAQVNPGWFLATVFEPDKVYLGLARQLTLKTVTQLETYLAENEAKQTQLEDLSNSMNDVFRQEVGDALGDLFG